MDHLLRQHAPISQTAWSEIDEEARQRLTPLLAARRIVDWSGPHGWGWAATVLGRVEELDGPPPGTAAEQLGHAARVRRRQVLPAAEVQVPFTLDRGELAGIARGSVDADFGALDQAARRVAEIENRAVFHGWPAAGIDGITSSHPSLSMGEDADAYPSVVARGVDTLVRSGVAGTYALVIGPTGYTRIMQATEDGYPLINHLRQILGGPVVWAPGVDGALIVSQRGGDFLFESGQDLAVGYLDHDSDTVRLYLEESFTFRCVEPDAAVVLTD